MATKGRSTKKKDGARSVRHGNVTYSSRPSDNTDCRIRCSPPSRQTFGDGSKQTTVRYRHRTLDIKSPPSGKKRKPGVRTGPKTTVKTATKTTPVKTVKKAPAKKTVPKTTTKTTAKKPVAKAPAKAPAKPTAPMQSRGVAGKFDAKQMKEIAQFIDKFDDDGRIPIFRQHATFIDDGHVMAVRVSSRIPGRSLVGLPISKTKADIWVPAKKIKERLSQAKDVQAVEYTGDSFEYTGNGGKLHFLMGNIDVATQTYRDYDDIRPPKMPLNLMKKDPGDIVFRTTQSRFATDMKKVMAGCEKGEDCAVQVCPEGKYSKYEDNVPMECSTYSAKYMKMIANVIAKAKNSSCVVIYRPAWPIKVVCDFGMYLVEIILAPIVG